MRTPEEARAYLMKLRQILRYIGVSAANMEEGNFRCDANVSLRQRGSTQFGAKVEVKNMNSFRSVFRALEYEVQRQAKLLAAGERIEQETRGWIDGEGKTVSQRSKEGAHDYRYFPEPDLPPLAVPKDWVESVRARLPELPDAKATRFRKTYGPLTSSGQGLSDYEIGLLIETRERADYFETCVEPYGGDDERLRSKAKSCANWILGELARLQNLAGAETEAVKVPPEHIRELIDLVEGGTLSSTMAKNVFERMYETGSGPARIVQESGLTQMSGEDELRAVASGIIAANPKAVEDYRGGKQEAVKFLFGQIMRETRGSANPEVANRLVRELLEA